jgi:very-short-patch-repair endonuclease
MTGDAAIARVAARQQGMVTRVQLRDAGFDDRLLRRRMAAGWLTRRHQGVYLLGVFAGPLGDEAAALLACGSRAAISHWTTAAAFGLRERMEGEPVHVVAAGGLTGRRAGVYAHRVEVLPARDVTLVHGLRMTTPARTLLDLAASTPLPRLDELVEEAEVRELVTRSELLSMLDRGAGRPGIGAFRAVVGSADEPAFTRSEAEKRLLALVRAAALPLPRTNTRIAGLEVDAVWPQQRLVVEVDGFQYHGTRPAFERDRTRDARLLVAGYRVLRITWRRLVREPEAIVAILAAALNAR